MKTALIGDSDLIAQAHISIAQSLKQMSKSRKFSANFAGFLLPLSHQNSVIIQPILK